MLAASRTRASVRPGAQILLEPALVAVRDKYSCALDVVRRQLSPEPWRHKNVVNRAGEGSRILRWNEALRRDDFRYSAHIAGDGRETGSHRFDQGPRQPLGARRHDEQVGRIQLPPDLCGSA